ncbi:30S ribosomal protein S16 [candidate division KSB1 bacterium]|nr:MAG: 30S ribosomal protein S16 [candidate division KSB1 bacterium]
MVKIRLARFGKKKQPTYRVVVTNARTKRNTLALEYLGSYNPFAKKDKFQIDQERYQYWLDNGAQPTYTVKSLMVINGLMKADIKKPKATNVFNSQGGNARGFFKRALNDTFLNSPSACNTSLVIKMPG